jgi:hypothetical protein
LKLSCVDFIVSARNVIILKLFVAPNGEDEPGRRLPQAAAQKGAFRVLFVAVRQH